MTTPLNSQRTFAEFLQLICVACSLCLSSGCASVEDQTNKKTTGLHGVQITAEIPKHVQQGSPAMIHISLYNGTDRKIQYIIAFNQYPDMQIEVVDTNSIPAELTPEGERASHKSALVFYTRYFSITITPKQEDNPKIQKWNVKNQKDDWKINLADYFELGPGKYTVKVLFPINDGYYHFSNDFIQNRFQVDRQDHNVYLEDGPMAKAFMIEVKDLKFEILP